ncbi:MAG: hypothetical protein ACE5E9_04335 [Nitrospinaceae bacterium]
MDLQKQKSGQGSFLKPQYDFTIFVPESAQARVSAVEGRGQTHEETTAAVAELGLYEAGGFSETESSHSHITDSGEFVLDLSEIIDRVPENADMESHTGNEDRAALENSPDENYPDGPSFDIEPKHDVNELEVKGLGFDLMEDPEISEPLDSDFTEESPGPELEPEPESPEQATAEGEDNIQFELDAIEKSLADRETENEPASGLEEDFQDMALDLEDSPNKQILELESSFSHLKKDKKEPRQDGEPESDAPLGISTEAAAETDSRNPGTENQGTIENTEGINSNLEMEEPQKENPPSDEMGLSLEGLELESDSSSENPGSEDPPSLDTPETRP